MNRIFLTSLLLISLNGNAQELFSMTEPASNIAAKSISIRIDQSIMDELNSSTINYHLIPELSFGVSKKFMMRGSTFFSNRSKQFRNEGGSLYGKYRFLSKDALQKHFRMAVFGTLAFNNSDIHQEEINMNGHNTGFEAGIVATQLLKKMAISSSFSFLKAVDNGNNNKFIYGTSNSQALNYSISVGKLMLPKAYTDYRQTNLNLMAEILSQVNTGSGKYYVDMAAIVQFIFNSVSRFDLGYRKQLSSDQLRTAPNGFFIRLEYNFFNAF